jgi:hypothetical protein
MVVEVVLGIVASSLALLADAGHMLTDASALGLALFAAWAASLPAAAVDVRVRARGDPRCAGERDHARRHRRSDRLLRDPAAV